MTSLLILSFVTLFLGPAVLLLAVRSKVTTRFIDAFVLCSVFGIVLFHVLPESIHHGGIYALLSAAVGLFGPMLIARVLRKGDCHLHHSLLSLASLGLMAHAMLDGMAIYGAHYEATSANFVLGIAVVLHRLPEGMGIWRLMADRVGKHWALFVLVMVALGTSAGFFFGESIIVYSNEQTLAIFEGLMGGVLLHVIFHREHLDQLDTSRTKLVKANRISTSLGALCGVILVIGLFVTQPVEHSHAKSTVRVADSDL